MIALHIPFIEQFHLSSKLASSCDSVKGGGVELLIVVLGDDEGALRPVWNHYVWVLLLSVTPEVVNVSLTMIATVTLRDHCSG